MKSLFSQKSDLKNNFVRFFCWIGLILISVILLVLRNSDPILQPAMYTEDGLWLGLAFTKGWLHTLLYAKEGYFVWGNIFLLAMSSISSKLICGNELICLPQAIAFYSYIFFGLTSTIAFFVTKDALPLYGRFILFFMIILMPLGDSSNEIIGRISNIGYLMVLWSVLLVYFKSRNNSRRTLFFADMGLIFAAATNPLCLVLIPILAFASSPHNIKNSTNAFFRQLFFQYKYIFFALFALIILRHFYLDNDSSPITGNINYKNLIEVGIARSILYPFFFSIYSSLNDQYVLLIFFIFIISLIFFKIYAHFKAETTLLLGLSLIAFLIFLMATIFLRQSLTQQLGGYLTTFPDRYFMGLNVLIVLIFLTLVAGGNPRFEGMKLFSIFILTAVCFLYIQNLGYFFELNKPRLKIVQGPTFLQSLCMHSSDSRGSAISLPIYFNGWHMEIPSAMHSDALKIIDCGKIQAQTSNDFYLTDSNWVTGVARNFAGFFVHNNEENRVKFKVGYSVIFPNGDKRVITSVSGNGPYLNILVDGEILDPIDVGFPDKFEVAE